MNLINDYNKIFNRILKTFILTFIFFVLFFIVLFIRGEGWDGDSIVNIAQFYKLIFFDLYGIPDGGTTPKLFPIIIFGVFHFIFNSYSIHWPVILICSYAFAKATQLPMAKGGGPLWFILPFISKTLIYAIISADNPALAIGFYILAITSVFKKKILVSFIFLLLAEFSRPGYCVLMVLRFCFFIFNNYLNLIKDKKKIILILFLTTIGFIHSLYLYKLAYPNYFEYITNNWDTFRYEDHKDSEFFINNKLFTIKVIFNSILIAIFSNNILPFPFSIFAIIALFFSFRSLKDNTSILFLQPIIYFPFIFAALTKGTIMADYRNLFFFKNLYASDPYYFITLVPIFLFSISLFANKLILKKNLNKKIILGKYFKFTYSHEFMKKNISYLCLPKIAILIAFILSIGNGLALKGKYEVNPTQSNLIKSKSSDNWLSDQIAKTKIKDIYQKKKIRIKILTTCDVIPILIDNGPYIKQLSSASMKIYNNKKKIEYLGSCYKSHFKKRAEDILLIENKKFEVFQEFDLLYTTNDMLKYFEIPVDAEKVMLKLNRILIINNNLSF